MTKRRTASKASTLATYAVLLACPIACSPEAEPDVQDPQATLTSLDVDLGPNSHGSQVRAVQQYLKAYGYFPNERLAREFPAWRPAVSMAPDFGTYDQSTADAVKALQRNSGLTEVGIVDAATRAVLRKSRCGVPDNIPKLDPANKFDAVARPFAGPGVSWTLTNTAHTGALIGTTGVEITIQQATAALTAAFNAWQPQTGLAFQQVSGAADITISFQSTCDMNNYCGSGVSSGPVIHLNVGGGWSLANSPPVGAADLQTVAMHEIGHSLGIAHSSIDAALMAWDTGGAFRTLRVDDIVAAHVLYNNWQNIPGFANDIAAGAGSNVWIIGTTPVGNGNFNIYKFNGGTGWTPSDGGGVRIATEADGHAWVVNAGGQIFRRNSIDPTVPGWQDWTLGASARDIGVGLNGSVWIISNTPVGCCNFTIKKLADNQ
jgi:peptidoglycan hydrolase-like protein with peptidoglycan-binding domain